MKLKINASARRDEMENSKPKVKRKKSMAVLTNIHVCHHLAQSQAKKFLSSPVLDRFLFSYSYTYSSSVSFSVSFCHSDAAAWI